MRSIAAFSLFVSLCDKEVITYLSSESQVLNVCTTISGDCSIRSSIRSISSDLTFLSSAISFSVLRRLCSSSLYASASVPSVTKAPCSSSNSLSASAEYNNFLLLAKKLIVKTAIIMIVKEMMHVVISLYLVRPSMVV
jgi:hypothetical protein